jgi:pSer/pThr/pTyr-binding forkhead associated (FHA) protein
VPAQAARALAGFLVSFEGHELGRYWPIYQGRNVVGRTGAALGLDVQIDHPTTSSRHAVILASARPARFKVEDTGSTNGTFIGETRLSPGTRHELRDGDSLRFGGFPVLIKLV